MVEVDPTIIVAIIGAVEAIGCAVIGAMISRSNRNTEEYRKKREELDKLREERDACNYDLLFATANACDVLLQAAHGDHVNGNVEEARQSIKHAKSECNKFYNRNAARLSR